MSNIVVESPTAIIGTRNLSRSAFLTEKEVLNPFSGVGDVYGIGQGLTAIFDNLPLLGAGSKSRINETKAAADANISILNAQNQSTKEKSKQTEKLLLIGFVALLVIVVVAGVIFTRR